MEPDNQPTNLPPAQEGPAGGRWLWVRSKEGAGFWQIHGLIAQKWLSQKKKKTEAGLREELV